MGGKTPLSLCFEMPGFCLREEGRGSLPSLLSVCPLPICLTPGPQRHTLREERLTLLYTQVR